MLWRRRESALQGDLGELLEGTRGSGGHRAGEGLWHWDSGVAIRVGQSRVGSGRAPSTVKGGVEVLGWVRDLFPDPHSPGG